MPDLDPPAFRGSFFTTTEYEEVWGEDWLSLFPTDLHNPGYSGTAVLLEA